LPRPPHLSQRHGTPVAEQVFDANPTSLDSNCKAAAATPQQHAVTMADVFLHVYDLSMGMARQLSPMLLGTQ
jgi:hypothetical protein